VWGSFGRYQLHAASVGRCGEPIEGSSYPLFALHPKENLLLQVGNVPISVLRVADWTGGAILIKKSSY
jgi:hypothetical protein